MPRYILQVLIAIDQLLNAILGGWADETLSARFYRLKRDGKPGAFMADVTDALFFLQENHCALAYAEEKRRLQYPAEYRTSPT